MTPADPPTDLELLHRWRDGDRRAGDLLYRRHFAGLYTFFRGRFANQQDVDDLVQESFLRVLRDPDRFREESSFKTYLYGVGRYVYLEKLRTMREQPFDASRDSLADVSGRRYSSILAHKDELRRLFDALRAIPITDQDILDLYYFQGLHGAEIAVILALNPNTVKSRLRLAREKLGRKLLELADAPADRTIDDAEIEAWLADARGDAHRSAANDDDAP